MTVRNLATGLDAAVLCAIAIAAISLLPVQNAQAEALPLANCPLKVKVSTFPLVVTKNFSRSFAAMDELGKKSRSRSAKDEGSVGNTEASTSAVNKMSWDAQGCATLNITVGFTNTTVYVAKELNRSPCAREHVLEHELEHIAIYRRALQTLASRVTLKLEPKIARIAPTALNGSDVDELLNAAMDEAATVMVEHAAFDSPAEYARNFTACDGAIARLYRIASRGQRV